MSLKYIDLYLDLPILRYYNLVDAWNWNEKFVFNYVNIISDFKYKFSVNNMASILI